MALRPDFTLMLAAALATGPAFPVSAAEPVSASRDPRAVRLSAALAARLDLRLLGFALGEGDASTGVWVEFADKGESDPSDLARRLADAHAALSPRALQRRIRNHVTPLIDYRDLPVHAPYLDALATRGFAVRGVSRWFNRVALTVTPTQLEALAGSDAVARIAPIERMTRSLDPVPGEGETGDLRRSSSAEVRAATAVTSLDYGQMAAVMTQMHIPAVHDSGYTGAGVLVAVLDAGFNWVTRQESMADLTIPLAFQRDFIRKKWGVMDNTQPWKHGTQVLGCMAGRLFGTYVGVAFDASFALARTEQDSSEHVQEMVNWGLGAEWADSLGADIISSSLGYTTFDPPDPDYTYADMNGHTTTVTQAAQIAASRGILVVNAVGNAGENLDPWHYLVAPSDANGDSVLAVGAVDWDGFVSSFSSYGPSSDGRFKPDIAARGQLTPLVGATSSGTSYVTGNGTSFATPLVAGAAACLMSGRPNWTARDVARALTRTASHAATPDNRTGYGIVNALAALGYDPVTGVGSAPAAGIRVVGPNPARLSSGLTFRLLASFADTHGTRGHLRLYDAAGRRVRELWSGALCCGGISIPWDGRDAHGRAVPAGLYFVSFESGGQRTTMRFAALQ